MAFSYFTVGDIVRLPILDGDWIEVKAALTYGEQQKLQNSMLGKGKPGDGEFEIDIARYNLLRILTWVTDWSLRDMQDKPVPVTMKWVEALHPKVAEAINEALDAHIEALEEGKDETATASASAKK